MGRRKRGKRPTPQHKQFRARTNYEIRVEKIRLVGFKDITNEVVPTKKAIAMAQEAGLDLVEINPEQSPPICKIIDYGKYKFLQEKKSKDSKKNQHVIQVKEIKLRPKIDIHDYEIKLKRAKEFLEKGDKVKVSLRFRGREVAHSDIGMGLVKKMEKDTAELSRVDSPAKMEGRQIVMILAPTTTTPKVKKVEPKTESARMERARKREEKVLGKDHSESPEKDSGTEDESNTAESEKSRA